MANKSKSKGSAWERKVAKDFTPFYGSGVHRGFQRNKGELFRPDVAGTPFWIECKCGANTDPKGAIAQAVGDMNMAKLPDVVMPVAICKDDRKDPIAVLRYSDFLMIVGFIRRAEGHEHV